MISTPPDNNTIWRNSMIQVNKFNASTLLVATLAIIMMIAPSISVANNRDHNSHNQAHGRQASSHHHAKPSYKKQRHTKWSNNRHHAHQPRHSRSHYRGHTPQHCNHQDPYHKGHHHRKHHHNHVAPIILDHLIHQTFRHNLFGIR